MDKPIVIAHAPCMDGFCAAWAVWRAFGGLIDYVPGVYDEAPPDVTGRHVIIVDFSFPEPVLRTMAEKAASVLVLDHHKTAQQNLAGVPRAEADWQSHLRNAAAYAGQGAGNRIGAIFDMNRSGCMLAWEYFHQGKPAPRLLCHVQDRDLWRFALIGTRQINAVAFSHDYDFFITDRLVAECEDDYRRARMIDEGEALLRQHDKTIRELLPELRRDMYIRGHLVPVANLPKPFVSDAAGLMAEGQPFAACYWDSPGYRNFSLRSRDGGIDVSEIARSYGGGGHKNAAGFRVMLVDLEKEGLAV